MLARAALVAWAVMVAMPGAGAATFNDPDWPCIQRKVSRLSIGQVWAGPPPDLTAPASADPTLQTTIAHLVARRTPLAQAGEMIDAIAAARPAEAERRLTVLFAGVFRQINRERGEIIAGIARYARRQKGLAAEIAANRAALTAAEKVQDVDKVEELTDTLAWRTRIFKDRADALQAVCESPVILERRVFALAKLIQARLP